MTRGASKALGTQTQSSIPHPMANSGRPFKVDGTITYRTFYGRDIKELR